MRSLLPASGDVALNVFTRGDFINSGPQPTGAPATNKFLTIEADGVTLGEAQGDENGSAGFCRDVVTEDSFTITKDNFNGYIAADDTLIIQATASADVDIEACRNLNVSPPRTDDVFVQLSYVSCLAAFPTSRPSLFPSVQPSFSSQPSLEPSTSTRPSLFPSVQPSFSSQPSLEPSTSFAPTCTTGLVNDITSPTQNLMDPVNGNEFVFTSLLEATDEVAVIVSTRGDFFNTAGTDKFLAIEADGVTLGEAQGNDVVASICITAFTEDSFTITKDDFNSYIAGDGSLTIQATASADVDIDRCRNLSTTTPRFDEVKIQLSYSPCTPVASTTEATTISTTDATTSSEATTTSVSFTNV